jgi:hypothetical protein
MNASAIDDDPPCWHDLDERTKANLCCDLIAADSAWFFDAVTDLPVSACIDHLRSLNDSALGELMRRAVLELCRGEIERRLDGGDFLP